METLARITAERSTMNTVKTSKLEKSEKQATKESALKKRKTTTEQSLKDVCLGKDIKKIILTSFPVIPPKNWFIFILNDEKQYLILSLF